MGEVIEQAITRVIKTMHENLGEPFTIDDMAKTAMFSKFHFSRVFRQVTGISPGRFLSAVRLEEAKRLLVSTSLSVADISNRVGYTSVGTFSARFKSSVGLAPTQYRLSGGFRTHIAEGPEQLTRSVTIRGSIRPPEDGRYGLVFAGLFPGWIPEGTPVRCTVLENPGPFSLEDVPAGTWYLLAQSVAPGQEAVMGSCSGEETPCVASYGPILVQPGTRIEPLELELRAKHTLDPPILLALLDARVVALEANARRTAGG